MALAGLSLLGLAYAYQPLTSAGFVYEDRRWMAEAARGRPALLTARPLMRWSWWVQAGSPAWAFHAVNLGLHLLVACLVGLLAYRLGLSQMASALAISLWALHPLTSETVAYLSARPELFAAIGVIGACVLAAGRWTGWTCLLVPLCLLFGLAGKETALVGCALVPLVVWAKGDRWLAELLTATGVWVVTVAVIVGGGIAAVANLGAGSLPRLDADWWPWLLVQSAAAMWLIGQSLVPYALTVDYDYDLVGQWARLASLIGLAGLSLLAYTQRHRRPLVTCGLAWTLFAILPRLLVQTPRGYLNEHQFYTVLVGPVLVCVSLWDIWRQRAEA